MAAPTMQPVKNFAFIKCDSVMEYDLLPDRLKGADQFIFADVPTSMPDARPNSEWFDSADSNFPASSGWKVNQFIEYTGTEATDTWVAAKVYRFYWNTNTNYHAARMAEGYVYVTDNASISSPAPISGNLFFLEASYTIADGASISLNVNESVVYSDNNAGTFSLGVLSDFSKNCGSVSSGNVISTNVSGNAFWCFRTTLFIAEGDSEIPAVGQKQAVTFDSEEIFPTTLAGINASSDTTKIPWTKFLLKSDGSALSSLVRSEFQNFMSPGIYEIGLIIPAPCSAKRSRMSSYSLESWLAPCTDRSKLSVVGGQWWNIQVNLTQTDYRKKQAIRVYKSTEAINTDKVIGAEFDLLDAAGVPSRGACIFYRKLREEYALIASVMDIIPVGPVASADGHLTGSNRLEGGVDGIRRGQIFSLFAGYNDPASTTSATTVPDSSYLRIGTDRHTFSTSKVFNTGLVDASGTSLNGKLWHKLTESGFTYPFLGVDMGRTNMWVSKPMRFNPNHRDPDGFGIYIAKSNNFSFNTTTPDNSTITASQYTYGLMTAAGKLHSIRDSDRTRIIPLSTVTGTASDSNYIGHTGYQCITQINERFLTAGITKVKLVVMLPGDFGSIDFDMHYRVNGSTNNWNKLSPNGTYPLPRNSTDVNNGVKYYRTPYPLVATNCGLYFTYKVYTIDLNKIKDTAMYFQLLFDIRGAFSAEDIAQIEELDGAHIIMIDEESGVATENLDGNTAGNPDNYCVNIDCSALDT